MRRTGGWQKESCVTDTAWATEAMDINGTASFGVSHMVDQMASGQGKFSIPVAMSHGDGFLQFMGCPGGHCPLSDVRDSAVIASRTVILVEGPYHLTVDATGLSIKPVIHILTFSRQQFVCRQIVGNYPSADPFC